MARTTSGSSFRPMCPAQGKRSIDVGRAVAISMSLASRPRTMRPAGAAMPARQRAATSRLASVADRPQTRSSGRAARNRASASSTCTPRLLAISSCHSSTITAVIRAKRSRQSARDSISVRLSGVVTSAVGRLPRLPGAGGGRGVAGAHVDGPVRVERRGGARQREPGVGGERAQRGQPQQRKRRCVIGAARRAELHGSDGCRVGLAHAGGRVHQAALARGVRGPDLFLEREGCVALRREPVPRGGERVGTRRGRTRPRGHTTSLTDAGCAAGAEAR